jgi:polyisoprenoid-binding protein YceI
MRGRNGFFVAVSPVLILFGVSAHAALSSPTNALVAFQAAGPAGLKIEGTTSDLKVAEEGPNVTISVPLANLTTGIALRDRHMRDKYLEVPKYPEGTLTIARSALKFPANGEKAAGDASGMLKLHGQTKAVSVHYDAKAEGGAFAVQGRFHINMTDFGINVPIYLGVTVKPDVDVSASFRVSGS